MQPRKKAQYPALDCHQISAILWVMPLSCDLIFPNPGWESGSLGSWIATPGGGTGSAAISTVAPRNGIYCVRLTQQSGYTASYIYVRLGPENPDSWRGRTVKFGLWYKSNRSTANYGNIQVSDDITTITGNMSGEASLYKYVSAKLTVSLTASLFQLTITTSNSAGVIIDVDDMDLDIDPPFNRPRRTPGPVFRVASLARVLVVQRTGGPPICR